MKAIVLRVQHHVKPRIQHQALRRYTTLPYATGGSICPLDGILLSPWSMPGGPYAGFNLGMSAVHEFGRVHARSFSV